MVADKPMKISGATKEALDNLKVHHRETYDDVISRLVASAQQESATDK
jgi:hypothetical protein